MFHKPRIVAAGGERGGGGWSPEFVTARRDSRRTVHTYLVVPSLLGIYEYQVEGPGIGCFSPVLIYCKQSKVPDSKLWGMTRGVGTVPRVLTVSM